MDGETGIYEIGPTEVVVAMTSETFKLPDGLCAFYSPLNRLAQQGLMLLNTSIVEPGYSGHLSCFILNFSSQPIRLGKEDSVVKLLFLELDKAPKNLRKLEIPELDYRKSLAKSAAQFHKSFMNVKDIEDKAAEKATKDAGKKITYAGIFIGFLLLFATLQPLIAKWVWEKTAVVSDQRRMEDSLTTKELENLLKT